MIVPVRYWVLHESDLPLGDVFNSSNWMFWHPGPDKHTPTSPPKGWATHLKRKDKSYGLVPHATKSLIRGSGVKPFLQRRSLQLPRQGGFFVVWVKTFPPVDRYPFYAFSMGLAHYRHCGPSAPFDEFLPHDELAKEPRKWFPDELPVGD